MAIDRRTFLQWAAAAALVGGPRLVRAESRTPILRAIPSSGESIPAIGMGTWVTFDVGGDHVARDQRVKVLQAFFQRGGRMIDSSPMYASSESTVGYALGKLGHPKATFAATKVWTWGKWLGVRQMEKSREFWTVPRFDLMQIHNMLDWESHLETLREWKQEGRIRYIGITTSHGRRHEEMEKALTRESFDFVQFTYNVVDREAEERLLPLARERGIAVIINRPFQRGNLFSAVRNQPLPAWAADFDCHNWAQFFLKYIISHPAVTCAIPATSRVDHMIENMGALYGRLPEPATRQRMAALVASL